MAVGLYIHVPFCRKKCPYCDFYSLVFSEELEKKYVNSVEKNLANCKGEALDSIYFGGGTPSILSNESYKKIFSAIRGNFVLNNPEITLEANPCTVDFEKLRFFHDVGFNRISFGVQSCVDSELKELGRLHNFEQAEAAVTNAKEAGFDNISCDLMLGIIGQTSETLSHSIDRLTELPITHISAYILKIESGTAYNNPQIIKRLPDEDTVSDLYLQAVDELSQKGFEQYEISNFSRNGFECRHNLKYWRCKEYIGIGPSAHSFFRGKRYAVPPSLTEFINNDKQTEYVTEENPRTFEEVAMLALRLREGLSFKICEEFGIDISAIIKKAEPLEKAGMLEISEKGIALTKKGFLVSNLIIGELI